MTNKKHIYAVLVAIMGDRVLVTGRGLPIQSLGPRVEVVKANQVVLIEVEDEAETDGEATP